MPTVTILGISAFYHDSSAALLRDGELVAAASEERFTGKKGDASFPSHAVDYCLREADIRYDALDAVGFYEKPLLKFERLIENYFGVAPRGFGQFRIAGPTWMTEKLWMDRVIRQELGEFEGDVFYSEHHESHAASAFYPSPFDQAAILTIDGVGEWATASCGVGHGADLDILKEMHWPDSLGLLYSAITYFTGFKVNSGEYKLMGLAPYGEPTYVQTLYDHVVDLKEDGSFRLNQEYFGYLDGLRMTNGRFDKLLGGPPRTPEAELTQREMDLARSVQEICEEIVLRMARTLHRDTGLDNVCLAGGVALNSVANGRLLREGPFDRVWIQPAAGDAGGAIGVTKLIWHRQFQGRRPSRREHDEMDGAYLGPGFGDESIRIFLDEVGAVYHRYDRADLLERTARLLADEQVVGWFQGRMEFGPRALGNRSILGDPRNAAMQARINLKVKFRESFRPFAPSVLCERAAEYFELDVASPYMLLVVPIQSARRIPMSHDEEGLWGIDKLKVARSDIPAVTHVDYSARVQTVSRDINPLYYDLIREFDQLTGCPVLVNTSFNVRGEPIVCTPKDAYRCFMKTDIDTLVLGSFLLHKDEQGEWQETGPWRWDHPLA